MGGIGFITAEGAEVMHDNVLINTHMLARVFIKNPTLFEDLF